MRFGLLLFVCAGAFAAAPAKFIETAPIQFQKTGEHRWTARGLGYAFRFDADGTAMKLGDRTLRMMLDGSNISAPFEGLNRSAHPTNFFHAASYTKIDNFARLRRTGIYPGIDIVYYGRNGSLEYDFEVAAGADPSRIVLRFDTPDSESINDNGDLVLNIGGKELIERAPSVYQRRASGDLLLIEASYKIAQDGSVRFALGKYDRSLPLVIDPAINYSVYLTGSKGDFGIAINHDSQGYIYIGGYTYSTDFPLGGFSYSQTPFGGRDIFLMKLNPMATSGDQVIAYSAYFGGGSDDTLKSMTVDNAGLMYFTGSTQSAGFPISSSAYQSTIAGNTHAFISIVDSNQDSTDGLIYSTFLGGTLGSEEGDGIFQLNGKVYVTGWTTSTDYPTVGGYSGSLTAGYDAFVASFDPTQSGAASLLFSTYLGGSAQDVGRAVAADSSGKIYVTGYTFSVDFPETSNAYENYSGGGDAFLSVLDPTSGSLVYSTFLGGATGLDEAKRIIVDAAGKRVAIAGYTLSTDFQVTQNGYQSVAPGASNPDGVSAGFFSLFDMTNLGAGKGLLYSTYLGGKGGELIYDLKADSKNRYYVCGYTLSRNFPVTGNALNSVSSAGGVDGFVAVIDPSLAAVSAKALVYSSFITGPGSQIAYGIDVDQKNQVWVTGIATGNIFPAAFSQYTTTTPSGTNANGKQEVFVLALTIN
jgi:hypothetical protein